MPYLEAVLRAWSIKRDERHEDCCDTGACGQIGRSWIEAPAHDNQVQLTPFLRQPSVSRGHPKVEGSPGDVLNRQQLREVVVGQHGLSFRTLRVYGYNRRAAMSLRIGSRLGPYEVVSLIGVGGMGEVYRARDTKLKRDVALKVLPEAFAADPGRMLRFQREAELLASLNHP